MYSKKTLISLILISFVLGALSLRMFNKGTNVKENKVIQNEDVTVPKGKIINLSGQGLEKLPSYVLSTTSVEELNLSDNKLTGALPSEIGKLTNLRVLNVSNNLMTGVPAEVGKLSNLEVLDLSNNKLTGLPYELGNLKKLKILKLSGNDYSKQDLGVIKKNLPSSVTITVD